MLLLRSSFIVAALVVSLPTVAQQASLLHVADDEKSERKNVLRSLLALKESEETIFWPLYEQYEQQLESTSFSIRTAAAQSNNPNSVIGQAFKNQYRNVRVKKEFFERINAAINGTIALKFLQSEALTELMQKSKYRELDFGEQLVWDKQFINDERLKFERMVELLSPSPESVEKLRLVFDDFEFEYSRVVGHQFVWFELYVEDPLDLTPAQCKKMGAEFLQQQYNEVRVAERFFKQLASDTDEKLAAMFIMLEDYFNTMAKLEVWSDLVLASR